MKPGWAVVWHGKSCVAYLKASDEWTMDPDEAFVFTSYFGARYAAGITKGVSVVRCWT